MSDCLGDNCRSGCKTLSHASYADCLRAASPVTANSTQSRDRLYGMEKRNAQEIAEYRAARAQGIQPAGTKLIDTRTAVAASRKADQALTVRR